MREQKPGLFQRLVSRSQGDPSPLGTEFAEARERSAVESILGNETLTAGLDDQSAKGLLKWGGTTARSLAQQGDEKLDDRLQSLRLLIRAINRWASSQPLTAHADQHPVLGEIIERAAVVYGTHMPDDKSAMLAAIKKMVGPSPEPAILIQGMLTWLDQSSSKE